MKTTEQAAPASAETAKIVGSLEFEIRAMIERLRVQQAYHLKGSGMVARSLAALCSEVLKDLKTLLEACPAEDKARTQLWLAARAVVDNWEAGDLAKTIRTLDGATREP